jgi:predicted membrane protein
LIPQKFLSIQFLLLLEFAAYKKQIVISFCYCSKYISSIKNKKKREKRKAKKKKKIVQKDVYWILPQKTKQEKIGSNQLGISSNLIL